MQCVEVGFEILSTEDRAGSFGHDQPVASVQKTRRLCGPGAYLGSAAQSNDGDHHHLLTRLRRPRQPLPRLLDQVDLDRTEEALEPRKRLQLKGPDGRYTQIVSYVNPILPSPYAHIREYHAVVSAIFIRSSSGSNNSRLSMGPNGQMYCYSRCSLKNSHVCRTAGPVFTLQAGSDQHFRELAAAQWIYKNTHSLLCGV
jgi:hypothetical protein